MLKNAFKEIFSWVKTIVFAFLLVILCRHYLFSPATVQGASMMPTFKNQNEIMIIKTSEIDRFDIIVFHSPDENHDYIKRVIGVSGDTIQMIDDQLLINGELFKESYLSENYKEAKKRGFNRLTNNFGPLTVPENDYFVMGDNRLNSNDSRIFGPISSDSVIGEVKFRLFPLKDAGTIK